MGDMARQRGRVEEGGRMQPLGFDRLGRLIYAGDAIRIIYPNDNVVLWSVESSEGVTIRAARLGFNGANPNFEIIVPMALVEVVLDFSPSLTNHERYFADLETLSNIRRLTNDICHSYSDDECDNGDCPFIEWGGYCNVDFGLWLRQKATV